MSEIGFAYLSAGIGAGLAVMGAGMGMGRLGYGAMEGTARQPEATGDTEQQVADCASGRVAVIFLNH